MAAPPAKEVLNELLKERLKLDFILLFLMFSALFEKASWSEN